MFTDRMKNECWYLPDGPPGIEIKNPRSEDRGSVLQA